mmetsp:Transcript_49913/g.119635  ORF Transcript_49913/g.119635 Transcript_49913/m.119635 type:complete len:203 (+) Transcript_49913:976-1584(+)
MAKLSVDYLRATPRHLIEENLILVVHLVRLLVPDPPKLVLLPLFTVKHHTLHQRDAGLLVLTLEEVEGVLLHPCQLALNRERHHVLLPTLIALAPPLASALAPGIVVLVKLVHLLLLLLLGHFHRLHVPLVLSVGSRNLPLLVRIDLLAVVRRLLDRRSVLLLQVSKGVDCHGGLLLLALKEFSHVDPLEKVGVEERGGAVL